MSSVVISGDTSGAITLNAPAVAGNTTLNLPASSGTVLTQNSSAPANSFVVDASGNVGIGTSSPTRPLSVVGNSSTYNLVSFSSSAAETNFEIKNTGTNGRTWNLVAGGNGGAFSSGQFGIYDATAGAARMCIDSSGNVLVGATSQFSGFVANAKLYTESSTADYITHFRNTNGTAANAFGLALSYSTTPNGTSNAFLDARDSTAQRAAIRSNGGLANYSANNVNLSDGRLKTDITPAKSYLDTICSIPVVTFKYNDQTDDELNLGVIAQDVDAVAPELIDHSGFGEAPEGESPYLAVYQTDLQYALMKCIQELKAIVDEQAEKIKALEAK